MVYRTAVLLIYPDGREERKTFTLAQEDAAFKAEQAAAATVGLPDGPARFYVEWAMCPVVVPARSQADRHRAISN